MANTVGEYAVAAQEELAEYDRPIEGPCCVLQRGCPMCNRSPDSAHIRIVISLLMFDDRRGATEAQKPTGRCLEPF